MLFNKNTAISTNKIVLVPYSEHHVPKYHLWMKNPDIQAATASEPLCLAEEYRMQKSWQVDSDKLTFISCLPHSKHLSQDEIDAMLGDVNLFVLINEEDNGDLSLVGELELMVARKENQKRGHGREALLTFLNYVLGHQSEILEQYFVSPRAVPTTGHFAYLRVKIKENNIRSISLFESLGFAKTEVSPNFFDEFELRNNSIDQETVQKWMKDRNIRDYEEAAYGVTPLGSPHSPLESPNTKAPNDSTNNRNRAKSNGKDSIEA